MRYNAQYHLKQFDDSIDSSSADSIFENPSYQDLLADRAMIEDAQAEIVANYEKAREDKNEYVLAGIREGLSEVQEDDSQKVMMNDLLANLSFDLGDKMTDEEKDAFAFFPAEDLAEAAEDNEAKINTTVNTLAQDPAFFHFDLKTKRNPQSIAPSAGKGGSINGSEFRSGTWALTYDDGPSGKYSPTVFANLRHYGIPATFFWLAQNVKANQSVVNKALSYGFPLANHSYSHPQLNKLSAAGLHKEIVTSTEIDTKAYGYKPKYFRCPYGAGASVLRVRSVIAGQGMVNVLWNVDSLDWQDKNPSSVANRVRRQMAKRGHGIILFHDIHPQSVAASKLLMQDWQGEVSHGKKKFLTIEEAVHEANR
jgi:peptidoglycan/xylan/chitin deacetylase (PgdA/CDA1 family)